MFLSSNSHHLLYFPNNFGASIISLMPYTIHSTWLRLKWLHLNWITHTVTSMALINTWELSCITSWSSTQCQRNEHKRMLSFRVRFSQHRLSARFAFSFGLCNRYESCLHLRFCVVFLKAIFFPLFHWLFSMFTIIRTIYGFIFSLFSSLIKVF